ncbi:MAG: amidohydrolase family protein [Chloroflexi bacterium]|nr:amidohydrolase family protein [Chloroflexota bacterium]
MGHYYRVPRSDGPPARPTLIRAGRLIDGSGAPALSDVGLLVEGEAIAQLGPFAAIRRPAGPLAEIDARDATVIPGLVDAHLHVTYSGHIGMQQLEWPASLESNAVCAGANAARALACGYTSAMDVGCRGRIGVATRDAIRRGVVSGPTMRVSGQILSTVGGPLDVWPPSMRIDPATRLTVLVSGVEDIRRVIREQARDGVDNVKLQISRSTVQGERGGRATTFSEAELRAAVAAAHDEGLSIAAHAEGPASVGDAIEAGFDTVHHASFIDRPTLARLERHPDCRLVFTLGVYDDIRTIGPTIGYPPAGIEQVEKTWRAMVEAVRLVADAGVPFAVGSDCGGAVHPHGRYARDVTLLVRECGLSAESAVRAASRDAARAAWIEGAGVLTPGAAADLVVVRGDLTKRIEALEEERSIALVMQRGRVVARAEGAA